MKLKARVIPYSSVVGGGLMLLDESGKSYCQLAIIGGRANTTSDDVMALATALVELVNDEGLVFGEAPDDLAAKRIRANMDKFLAWMPTYMRAGMERYVVAGIMPGSFLRAILEGDAKQARIMADANNARLIPMYFEKARELLPPAAHGDEAKVKAWIARHGLNGHAPTEGENAHV